MELFVMKTTELKEQSVFEDYVREVSPKRRSKAERYHYASDRALSLGAGLLLGYVLREKVGVKQLPVQCQETAYGKPYLKEYPEIAFNLSHAGEYVICALQKSGQVGADIEQIKAVKEDLILYCYTERERSYISRSPKQQEAFFRLWVLKEAYLKAIGTGLHTELKDFSILIEDKITVEETVHTQEWYFQEYAVEEDYRIAVCSSLSDFREHKTKIELKDIWR